MGLTFVEIIMGWESSFALTISDAEAARLRTPRHAIELLYARVRSPLPEDHGSLMRRACFRLHAALPQEGVRCHGLRPETKLAALLPAPRRRDALSALLTRAGLRPLQPLPLGLQFTPTVEQLLYDIVTTQHAALRLSGHGWSRAQVRQVVRTVVYRHLEPALRSRHFSDDAEFQRDLQLD